MGTRAMPIFTECLPCNEKWFARDDFLEDPEIEIIGYHANFDDLLAGNFIFNHSCGVTNSISVRYFNGLYEGTIYKERATGTDDCPEYCLYQDKLDQCFTRCECAFVRNIIDIIKKWPKKRPGGSPP